MRSEGKGMWGRGPALCKYNYHIISVVHFTINKYIYNQDEWELVGVVSTGSNCGVPETIFTRVVESSIRSWIKDTAGV